MTAKEKMVKTYSMNRGFARMEQGALLTNKQKEAIVNNFYSF